ncbi:hypothetical protein [Microbulbifer sp. ZKSA002]|uniref:hypothetical protein n=1 Tax=Microbulbifer sp. ZKSA002 TaxID=3243388 RepID=UPI0040392C70
MSQDKTEAVMCEAMVTVVAHMFRGMFLAGVSQKVSSILISLVCHESTDTESDSKVLFEAGKAQALATVGSPSCETKEAVSEPIGSEDESAGFITKATMIAHVAYGGLRVGLSPAIISRIVNYLIKSLSHSAGNQDKLRIKALEISSEMYEEGEKQKFEKPSDDTPEIGVELEAVQHFNPA